MRGPALLIIQKKCERMPISVTDKYVVHLMLNKDCPLPAYWLLKYIHESSMLKECKRPETSHAIHVMFWSYIGIESAAHRVLLKI